MQDARIARYVAEDPVARRLITLRGVGPLIATALVGALGDGSAFDKGRDFATSLGPVPRQLESINKPGVLRRREFDPW